MPLTLILSFEMCEKLEESGDLPIGEHAPLYEVASFDACLTFLGGKDIQSVVCWDI